MFRNAKVGDRVWDILKGWGTITSISEDNDYPIRVTSDEHIWTIFTLDGKRTKEDINPSLFWDKIKFEAPEKPFSLEEEFKKLKVVQFEKNEKNYYLLWENEYGKIEYDYLCYQEYPLMKYFNKKSIDNFMDNIKDKKITKEEFFKTYNKVFGGK